MAARIFNKKQSLEREVKELYLKATVGTWTAATATLDLTADIVLTSVAKGDARNTTTFTLQVVAAAANPTNTVLAAFTGTAAAITLTITPNDGTNNAATPVNLTTAQVRELITTGAVVGKSVTITDASSLRALQTATGGGATAVADAGEGDAVVATFASGAVPDPTINSGYGIASIARTAAGDYTITLQDTYNSFKFAKGKVLNSTAVDLRFQLHSETVSSTKLIRAFSLTGATKTDIPENYAFVMHFDLKNTAGF